MLSTMAPPIFNFDFNSHAATAAAAATPHRPTVSSPLSSSPIRASQSSPVHGGFSSSPPLSPRDPNTLPRHRDVQSSPLQCSSSAVPKFKFAARPSKPNPVRQSRENAQESRRRLFLKNVRQRADDRDWERRGGDQEALRLEWAVLDRRRREQKDADLDGLIFEDDALDQIPDIQTTHSNSILWTVPESDEMMADAMALEEQRELDAMLSMLEPEMSSSSYAFQAPVTRPDSPSLSDDEYDDLFLDLVTQQQQQQGPSANLWSVEPPHQGREDFVCSSQMDMS